LKSRFHGIFFDLDGTLIDSRRDLAQSVNFAISHLGLPTLPDEEIFGYIGNGMSTLIQLSLESALGDEPSRLLDVALTLFKKHYKDHLLDNTTCYSDVFDTLKSLEEFNKVVITNKIKEFSVMILEGLNLNSYFDIIIGGDEVYEKKPSPEGILKALKMLKLSPENVIIVGDNYTDIESGQNAGISTCFASYGIGKLRNTQPKYIINSLSELIPIIYEI